MSAFRVHGQKPRQTPSRVIKLYGKAEDSQESHVKRVCLGEEVFNDVALVFLSFKYFFTPWYLDSYS